MVLFGGSPHSFSHVVKSRDKITFIGVQQQQQQQCCNLWICRSQWPRVLRRRSAAARLLGLWVRIPPGAWIFVCCECCVLSGRGLCDDLITHPEESYRMWCVVVCDLETSRIGAPYIYIYIYIYIYDTSSLRVNDWTLILLTWRKWWNPNNASK